jgi:uncharacterized membrane protein YqjE
LNPAWENAMPPPSENHTDVTGAGKRLGQRLFLIMENRLQLLMVEAQEEREKLLMAILLALGAAAFGLLAGVALTVVVAVALWDHSAILAMLVLTALYTTAALGFYLRLTRMQRNWQTLSATLEQLKKDRECLEKNLI